MPEPDEILKKAKEREFGLTAHSSGLTAQEHDLAGLRAIEATAGSNKEELQAVLDFFQVHFQTVCGYVPPTNYKTRFVFAKRIMKKCLTLNASKEYIARCFRMWEQISHSSEPTLREISSKRIFQEVRKRTEPKRYEEEDL